MRPFPGDDAPPPGGRPRVSDSDGPSTAFGLPAGPQMTFFFADESSIGSTAAPPPPPHLTPTSGPHRSKENRKASTTPAAEGGSSEVKVRQQPNNLDKDRDESNTRPGPGLRSQIVEPSEDNIMSRPQQPVPTTPPFKAISNPSGPVTPIMLEASTGPASVLSSSVSSRRNSFAGSLSEDFHLGGSQLPPSLLNDSEERQDIDLPASMMDSGSAPQLIMPSIKMPSRRPFTEEGKAMGRLKVMIAGESGIGKTSLVKAIVQSCEHIVHVDPIGPSMASSISRLGAAGGRGRNSPGGGGSGRRGSSKSEMGTSQITEIYASTKPYPEWWSEIDDFSVLKRRKSLGDTVLDRNICFVDTPGYGSLSSGMDTITPVARYVETHLHRMNSNSLADGDVLNLLGGEGGVQVDIVFYMVSNKLRPVDLAYLRQLAPLTNIIILIAQADLMSPEQLAASKEQILGQLHEANIRLFSFSMPATNHPSTVPSKSGLYAISNAAGSDHDIMDASLLMSPDYVQPLISSELSTLVEQVFSQNGAAWLRHSAARKYVQWRKTAEPSNASPSPRASLSPPPVGAFRSNNHMASPSEGLSRLPSEFSLSSRNGSSSQVMTPAMGATSSYALARITDHTHREERLAQVRLANWAAELQKSLAKERAEYEAIARGERAIWLTEKLNECVQDGTLVAVSGSRRTGPRSSGGRGTPDGLARRARRRAAPSEPRHPSFSSDMSSASASSQGMAGGRRQHEDPLGLLQVAADLRYKGIVALEVLGSLGVLGGLALWLSRQMFQLEPVERIAGEWDRAWGGR